MGDSSSLLPHVGIRPKKGLGQNFLVDAAHRGRIVAAAELTQDDTVLEIGPGLGVLTELIAQQAGRLVAVELDDRLIPLLRERFAAQPHVTIVHGDVLELDIGAVMTRDDRQPPSAVGYKVVANLPYYITSAAIRHLLESDPPPDLLVLTVQREVAERMVASPPEMSLLALGVQFYCTGQIVDRIPAGAFHPAPKVDSAVVRLVRRPDPVAPEVTAEAYFRVARGVQPAAQAAPQFPGGGVGHESGAGGGVVGLSRRQPTASRRDAVAGRVGKVATVAAQPLARSAYTPRY